MRAAQKYIVIMMILLISAFHGKGNPFNHGESSCDTTFIYDDGSAETGWGINEGYLGWLGDYFPVSQTTSGVLHSFDVYFITNTHGSNVQLTIDVFNSTYALTGSTSAFTAAAGVWIPVPSPDINFSGPFYTMVKWNSIIGVSHYLGLDTNGSHSQEDLERYYNGDTFHKLSEPGVAGGHKGVFLVRAHATLHPFGITGLIQPEPLMVFPLPAKNFLNVAACEDIKEVKLTDLLGKTILTLPSENRDNLSIDISGIPDGIYILSVATKTGTSIKKICIQH
jgi:hypothetical protein